MTAESFLNGRVTLWAGDSLQVLPSLDENSVDSCVCDPPYHLTSIVKRFGADNAAPAKSNGATGVFARSAAGFMGKRWDGGDIAFQPDLWREVYRALKPGAHLVAFGGTRTYHRMACAIEDAGFEIRDCIQWLYGSGFPKSLDVSKAIDKAAGARRERLGTKVELGVIHAQGEANKTMHEGWQRPWRDNPDADAHFVTIPTTEAATLWDGFGTALKPACEPIVLARKPLSEGTVAANVLKWGTGALNIDGCRVEFCGTNDAAAAAAVGFASSRARGTATQSHSIGKESRDGTNSYDPFTLKGRWPANVCHDGSDEVVGAFPESGPSSSGGNGGADPGMWVGKRQAPRNGHDDIGGTAARFFYTAKADSDDRLGSKHPTVKPLDLMQWLVRLVTPPKGLVLDCFAGTGTTGEAAFREGMRSILIEREAEYQADIRRRMALVLGGQNERRYSSIKEKMKGKPVDHGPLFSELSE